MMAERFPDFKFTHNWKGDVDVLGLRIYGFVRERTDYWYDYLPIGRRFDEDEEGHLSIDTWLGVGCAPWYEWNYYLSPWRAARNARRMSPDEESARPRALLGFWGDDCYQLGTQVDLDSASESLAYEIQRCALPAFEAPISPEETQRLQRWHDLAECILPQLEDLAAQDPEGYEEMKLWTKKKNLRRWEGLGEGVPARMVRWWEEISQLPSFAEEWDKSINTQGLVFHWFANAFYLRP